MRNIQFTPHTADLDFIVSSEFTPQTNAQFRVISPEEARETFFPEIAGRTNVYVVVGAAKGDEGKGCGTRVAMQVDNRVGWASMGVSTHNAGTGTYTVNVDGEEVRFTLHLTPTPIVVPRWFYCYTISAALLKGYK